MSSIKLDGNVFVKIVQQNSDCTGPLPLNHGFRADAVYAPIALLDYSETSEAYFFMANEAGEFWAISNRHCRLVKPLDKEFSDWDIIK